MLDSLALLLILDLSEHSFECLWCLTSFLTLCLVRCQLFLCPVQALVSVQFQFPSSCSFPYSFVPSLMDPYSNHAQLGIQAKTPVNAVVLFLCLAHSFPILFAIPVTLDSLNSNHCFFNSMKLSCLVWILSLYCVYIYLTFVKFVDNFLSTNKVYSSIF